MSGYFLMAEEICVGYTIDEFILSESLFPEFAFLVANNNLV